MAAAARSGLRVWIGGDALDLREGERRWLLLALSCMQCHESDPLRKFFREKEAFDREIARTDIFLWAKGEGVKRTAEYTSISDHTTSLIFGQLQDACAVWADRHPAIIGSPGQAGQIDETAITTRRQHVGRVPRTAQIWVFDWICEETGECFCEVVPDRRRGTLVPLIEKHVRPGTRIKSDGWGPIAGLTAVSRSF